MAAVYDSIPPLEELQLDEPVPLERCPGLVHGTLANGLRFFVRRVAKPPERAAVALAVRVGSLAEEEHERGVAHIVEHLCFNATENYENHELIAFLEKCCGAAFGAHQNAYTSADATVFELVVPTTGGDLGALAKALGVMAEWAARVRCADGDLAKERGAVLEELRLGRDSAGRQAESHWRLLLQGCRYAERLPIGTEAVIRGVKAADVKAFYRRWYHPSRMAVVVVGDFGSAEEAVALIEQQLGPAFGGGGEGGGAEQQQLPPPPPPPLPVVAPREWQHREPRFAVFTDKEAADTAVYLTWKVPFRPTATPRDYLAVLTSSLLNELFSARLFRLSRLDDPPFFSALLSDEPCCAAVDLRALSLVCEEGKTLRALEAALTELARLRLHGITAREFDAAARGVRADIESTWLERDQAYAEDVRDEYARHFLTGEFVSGQEYEARLSKALLPLITPADVVAAARQLRPSDSLVVKTVEHRRWFGVSERALAKVVAKVAAAEAAGAIGPYVEPDLPARLMAPPAVPREWYEASSSSPPPPSPTAAGAAAAAGVVGSQQRQASLLGHQHGRLAAPAAAASADAKPPSPPAETGGAEGPAAATTAATAAAAAAAAAAAPSSPRSKAKTKTTMPYPGVVAERHFPDLGVRELTLVNGMRVAVKHTDLMDDEVLVTAVAIGGLSEVCGRRRGLQPQQPQQPQQQHEQQQPQQPQQQQPQHDSQAQERERFVACQLSGVVAAHLGALGFPPEVLSELIAGLRVSLGSSEGAYARTARGSASPVDLEHELQLLHLLFTSPVRLPPPANNGGDNGGGGGADNGGDNGESSSSVDGQLRSVLTQIRLGVEAQERSPLTPYHRRVRAVNYGACPFFEPVTLADLAKVDRKALQRAADYHNSGFSDPSEFTVVLTGAAKLADVLPLVTQYLATIPPATGRRAQQGWCCAAKDGGGGGGGGGGDDGSSGGSMGKDGRRDPRTLTPLDFRFPESPVVEDVSVAMVSPLTQTQITFPVRLERTAAREHLWWCAAACRLLETRLLQKLRFKHGKLYTVTVSSFFGCECAANSGDALWGDCAISYTCSPDSAVELRGWALEELERLQEEGPTGEELETVRHLEELAWQSEQTENSYWHDVVVAAYQSRRYFERGGDLDDVWRHIRDSRVRVADEMLNPERMRDMFRRLLPYPCRSRYTALTMLPRQPGPVLALLFGALRRWQEAPPAARAAAGVAGAAAVAAGVAALALAFARRRRAQ